MSLATEHLSTQSRLSNERTSSMGNSPCSGQGQGQGQRKARGGREQVSVNASCNGRASVPQPLWAYVDPRREFHITRGSCGHTGMDGARSLIQVSKLLEENQDASFHRHFFMCTTFSGVHGSFCLRTYCYFSFSHCHTQ